MKANGQRQYVSNLLNFEMELDLIIMLHACIMGFEQSNHSEKYSRKNRTGTVIFFERVR